MARTAYSRNSYDGGATQASLSNFLDTATTTIVLANTNSSWDSLGVSYGFFMSLDYGGQNEEKVYVPVQTSAPVWTETTVTLYNVVRGVDGTGAKSHDAAGPVAVVMTATDLDEANYTVTQTVGLVAAQGDLLYGNGANTLARLAAGTAGRMLTTQGAGAAPTWVDASNVWTGATTYTVSGFANYLVLADVTLTQPATGFTSGAVTLSAGGKTVSQSYPGTANWVQYITTSFVTSTGGSITASASKNTGASGTLSTINLTVIGLN